MLIGLGLVSLLLGAAVIAIRRWWRLRRHDAAWVKLKELDAAIMKPGAKVTDDMQIARMRARERTELAANAVAVADVHAEHARAAVRGVVRLQAAEVEELLRRAGL